MIAIFPEIISLARGAEVERLAVAARRYFESGTPHPRPDLVKLLEAAGLSVATLAASPAIGLGALVARDQKGAFRIGAVLPPGGDELATRFVLAHLFGHYLLDVLPLIAAGDYAAGGFREAACPLKRYALTAPGAATMDPAERKERRADAFAAALLLPVGMVKKALDKIGDVGKAAAFFGVTRACLERRLLDIDGGDGYRKAPDNFLDAEAKIGGVKRKNEAAQEALVAAAVSAGEASGVPKAVAAARYGKVEKAAKAPPAPAPTAPTAPVAAKQDKGGLERLRAIARSLDKSVPK